MRRLAHSTMGAQRHAVVSDTEFKAGDRVLADMLPGVVMSVDDTNPYGIESYEVTLDNGLGGGEYTGAQLQRPEATTASLATQQAATDELGPVEGSSSKTADFWYPELGSILTERLPNERIEVTGSLRRTAAVGREDSSREAAGVLPDDASQNPEDGTERSEDLDVPGACSWCGNPGPWVDEQDTGRGTRIRCGTCAGTMRKNTDEVAGTSSIQWQPEFNNSPENHASRQGDPRATTNLLNAVHSRLNAPATEQAGYAIFTEPELHAQLDQQLRATAASLNGVADEDFVFSFTATWADVRKKATRIRKEGGVRILSATRSGVVGEVQGDTAIYESALNYVPGSKSVADWQCGCKWGAYSWGRSPAYHRFEGRQCSHVLALQYEANSQGMFGREVTPSRERLDGQHPHSPVTVQYQRPTDSHPGGDINRRTVPPGNMRRQWDPNSRVRVKSVLQDEKNPMKCAPGSRWHDFKALPDPENPESSLMSDCPTCGAGYAEYTEARAAQAEERRARKGRGELMIGGVSVDESNRREREVRNRYRREDYALGKPRNYRDEDTARPRKRSSLDVPPVHEWARLFAALGTPPSEVMHALHALGVPHSAARAAIDYAVRSDASAAVATDDGQTHQVVAVDQGLVHTASGAQLPGDQVRLVRIAMPWIDNSRDKSESADAVGAKSVRHAGFKGYVGSGEDYGDFGAEDHNDFDEDAYDRAAPEPTPEEHAHHEQHDEYPDSYYERHDHAYAQEMDKKKQEDVPDHDDEHLHHFIRDHGTDGDLWQHHEPQPQQIDLRHGVYATQSHVGQKHVDRYLSDPHSESWHQQKYPNNSSSYLGDGHPLFVTHNGDLHAIEGHHRVAAALQRGDSHIEGYHYNLDKHPVVTNEHSDDPDEGPCEECQYHAGEDHHTGAKKPQEASADYMGGQADPGTDIYGIDTRNQSERKREPGHLQHHTNDARSHAPNFGYGLPWGGSYLWCDQCNGSGCGHCGGTGQVLAPADGSPGPSEASTTNSPIAGQSVDAGDMIGGDGEGMSATGAKLPGTDCACCQGTGEHGCGHECYACDASGKTHEDDGGELCAMADHLDDDPRHPGFEDDIRPDRRGDLGRTASKHPMDDPRWIWKRCPYCFAKDGQPCRSRKGNPTSRIHNGRGSLPNPDYQEPDEEPSPHIATYSANDFGSNNPAQTYERPTPHVNSPNPASTGWGSSADPQGWKSPLSNSTFGKWESMLHHGFVMTAAGDTSKPPTVAGVALKANDTGRVLMIQRSNQDEKDPARGSWEFPGGHREDGDLTSLHAGIREFEEEVGQPFPEGGHLTHVHRSGPYVLHTVVVPDESALDFSGGRATVNPDDPHGTEHEQSAWWDPEHAKKNPALRQECKSSPWGEISKAASLNDEPEPALPSTTGDQAVDEDAEVAGGYGGEDSPVEEPAPGVPLDRAAPWGFPESAADHPDPAVAQPSEPAPGPVQVSPEMAQTAAADPVIAGFMQTAGFRALMTDGAGGDAGGVAVDGVPNDTDIAAAAREMLSKTSMKTFSHAEQQELISEGGGKARARNFGDLKIAGTHYENLGDEPVDDEFFLL